MTLDALRPSDTGPPTERGRRARTVEMVLGGWLVLSTFLWPHTLPQRVSTCVVGLLIMVSAFLARQMRAPRARFVNVLAAFWLGLSTWMLAPSDPLTATNNIVVAAGIILFAFVPSRSHSAT